MSVTARNAPQSAPLTPPGPAPTPTVPLTQPGASAGSTATANAGAPPAGADPSIVAWVARMAALTLPADVVWCDGSAAERATLIAGMVEAGTLIPLNSELRPGSYLARSHPDDVARVESRTFLCTPDEADAGPTNHWAEPGEMRATLRGLFAGAMRGRTMYVIPFAMGPVGGPLTRYGVQVTDSPYVVVSMGTMTRMGTQALRHMGPHTPWVPAAHTVGAPLAVGQADVPWPCNSTKYICQFPATREIWSYGSAYGGNAILAKKAFALRIASAIGQEEGWLAAHMLLLKVTNPRGRVFHLAAAFPSACGKTNFAMLQPTIPGWTVETLGDDIVWIAPGPDGRLRAINPEAGFFGVAPGTGRATNPVAIDTLGHDVIFTNVALTDDGDVWWEGLTAEPPAHLTDWTGQSWTPDCGRPAAHANSRFTVAAAQCPTIAAEWNAPEGVVLDAVIFGGRRATNVPLVSQARDWEHGMFMGATLASERTAAAEGTVGELRRDPFAMLPFAGVHMADHWRHWLEVGARAGVADPAVFQVNWFRKGADGRFLWPGFGDNIHVLAWMLDRLDGRASGVDSPFGWVPSPGEIDARAAGVDDAALTALFAFDKAALDAELDDAQAFLDSYGARVPAAMFTQVERMRARVAEL